MTRSSPGGIGIDFGATACRAVIFEDGQCRAATESFVPTEGAVLTSESGSTMPSQSNDPLAPSAPRWLRLETVKANLGTGRRLRDLKGYSAYTFEAQAQVQLHTLKSRLEECLHAEIVGAAVGVPVCYGMNQRATLRSIAESAGFGKVGLLDESIAAAWSSYRDLTHPCHVLVYCLGRSVFGVSVLQVGDGAPRALNHEGSVRLGGQDFEALLVERIAEEVLRTSKINIGYDREMVQELIERAEEVKIALSTAEEAAMEIGPTRDLTGRSFQLQYRVSRADLEQIAAPLVARTITLSQEAVQGAGLSSEDIAQILLVGEATRTPLVVRELSRVFDRPTRHATADAVACGAALYAASLQNCFVRREGSRPPGTPVVPVPAPECKRSTSPIPAARESEDPLLVAVQKVRRQIQTSDWEAGIEAFEALLNQAREELSYLYSRRASQLRQEGKPDEAQANLERGLSYWPSNTHIRKSLAEIHSDRARRYAKQHAFERCEMHLSKSLDYDPENLSARLLAQDLERVLAKKGKKRFFR